MRGEEDERGVERWDIAMCPQCVHWQATSLTLRFNLCFCPPMSRSWPDYVSPPIEVRSRPVVLLYDRLLLLLLHHPMLAPVLLGKVLVAAAADCRVPPTQPAGHCHLAASSCSLSSSRQARTRIRGIRGHTGELGPEAAVHVTSTPIPGPWAHSMLQLWRHSGAWLTSNVISGNLFFFSPVSLHPCLGGRNRVCASELLDPQRVTWAWSNSFRHQNLILPLSLGCDNPAPHSRSTLYRAIDIVCGPSHS